MLSRYALPEMSNVWSNDNRFQRMLDVEIAAAEALADLGAIPKEAFIEIQEKAPTTLLQRFEELEMVVGHDLNAFLAVVGEQVGASARYLHLGLTSSDVLDTALSMQMRQAVDLLEGRLYCLREVLVELARRYKYTLMIGRTHGVHAEPITFGLKMALWIKEVDRSLKRLHNAREVVNVGKLSGVVGTFANIDPHVETFVCRKLGLHPAHVTTQTLQRDRHAEFVCTLAIIASSLDKFATEIRNLQRTEILEVEELRSPEERSSTSMPHKRNPVLCERISGLARVLRGYALAAMEGIPIWHERDLTHATTERVILPDSCIVLDYMLHTFTHVMENLLVFPDNMRKNLDKMLGLVFSQRVLLAMLRKGVSRDTAYEWVQRNARTAWDQQTDFEYLILEDADIAAYLSREEIMDLFDYDYHLKNIDYIFKRAEI